MPGGLWGADPTAGPLPLRDRAKVLALALVTLALLCTKVVKLGPERDPLIDPSIDPNNLQGLKCVGPRSVWGGGGGHLNGGWAEVPATIGGACRSCNRPHSPHA